MGHPIVMGRKTFESLPKVLPGRKNIVISTSEIRNEQIELYKSIKEFLINYQNFNEDVFIIGGASIYEQFIDLATKMYLTEIKASDKNADVYFPKFNKEDWTKEILTDIKDNDISFNHVLYKRK
jgi:dihydrofolate reductase